MTMRASETARLQERLKRFKKKKKDTLKNKVKEKLKDKKKNKSTKGGILSKAGLMPVSTPGGIPKVMSQKTAQKDPPKRRPTPGKEIDRMPRPPKGFPDNPSILRPKNPPRKFIPMGGPKAMTPEMKKKLREMGVTMRAPGGDVKKIKKTGRINKDDLARAADKVGSMLKNIQKNPQLVGSNKQIMNLAKRLKPTGRLSTTDLARARAALQKAFKEDRDKLKMRMKGQKPVFKTGTKEKVKGLTQKAGQGKPLTAAQKKQLRKMMDNVSMRMPKTTRPKKGMQGMIPLMGSAGKGMRRAFGGKNMRSAAKKMKRIM